MRAIISRIMVFSILSILASGISFSVAAAPKGDSLLKATLAIGDYHTRMQTLYDICTKTYDDDPQNGKLFANAFLDQEKKHPNDSNKAKAYFLQGDIALLSGDYKTSLEYNLKALRLAQQLQMHTLQIEILSDISGVYLRTDDVKTSMGKIQEALDIARQQRLRPQEARMTSFLAIRYLASNQAEKAIPILDTALQIALEQKMPKLVENMLELKATGYGMLQQFDKAQATFLQAMRVADSIGSKNTMAAVRLQLANLYSFMNRYPESERVAREALSMSGDIHDPAFFISIYSVLQKVYQKMGNYEPAYEYLSLQRKLEDSLFTTQKAAQIEELQTRYDTEVKDKTIATQAIQLNFNKKVNILLWIGLGLVAIIGMLIYRSQQRTRRFNVRISKQSAELESKGQELTALNQVKDRLFGVISHDLRTPVNALISFTDLLDNTNLSPEKLKQYLEALKQNLGHTSDLLENLLYFARTQIQTYQPRLKEVDILEKIEDALAINEPSLRKKALEVTVTANGHKMAMGDDQMVALTLRNLLSNAGKFSYEKGKVTITIYEHQGKLHCCVQDEGTGLSAELVATLNTKADKYVPVDSTMGTQHEKGSGLGLTLCRTFVHLMGGSLVAASEAGKGTSFTLILPAATAG